MGSSPTSAPRSTSPATEPAAARQTVNFPMLTTTGPELHDARRPSVQFLSHSNASLPRGSPKQGREKRRMSSPPPPPVFQPRVSFDTFDKPADFIEENSFTLVSKHKDYEYTKRSRTFLCGYDANEYSEYALQWLVDELVDDGDEIVCLRVVEKDSTIAADPSVEQGRYRSEAEGMMKQLQSKNHENKAINLILEFAVGKVNKVIDEMINLYEPAILIVGTRGRSLGGFQGLLPGSVSKYCLQHSPVPVIVVRPSYKRDKARSKRAQDPSRHAYKDILEKSGPQAGHILDTNSAFVSEGEGVSASDDEAAAVAAAIGYKQAQEASPLVHVENADPKLPDAIGGDTYTSALDDLKSPGIVMKSPELENLETPEISDVSSSEDDADDQGGVPTTSEVEESPDAEGDDIKKESEADGDVDKAAQQLSNTTLGEVKETGDD